MNGEIHFIKLIIHRKIPLKAGHWLIWSNTEKNIHKHNFWYIFLLPFIYLLATWHGFLFLNPPCQFMPLCLCIGWSLHLESSFTHPTCWILLGFLGPFQKLTLTRHFYSLELIFLSCLSTFSVFIVNTFSTFYDNLRVKGPRLDSMYFPLLRA